jgi:chaperonin GroES
MIKLIGNRVLVEEAPQAAKSAGGIHYSQHHRDDHSQFTVLAVGPGRRLKNGTVVKPEVERHQRVVAPLYRDHVQLEGGLRIVDASQIIAVVEENKP